MNEMEEIIKEFVVESNDNLDRLDHELIELEKNPSARETLASIFRTFHSIKGATGFLGFSKLGAVAHAGESLLSRLRDGVLTINSEIASGLLTLVDCARQILSQIEKTGAEGSVDYSVLVENLARLQVGGKTPDGEPPDLSTVIRTADSRAAETGIPDRALVATKSHDGPDVDITDGGSKTVFSPQTRQDPSLDPEPTAADSSDVRFAQMKPLIEQMDTSHES